MNLAIYGAGGLGRDVLILANQINDCRQLWGEIFFVDDTKNCGCFQGKRVLTFQQAEAELKKEETEFVIALGEPLYRKILREKLNDVGFRLATLVHPSVFLPSDSRIGEGCVVCNNTYISSNVILKENNIIQPFVYIGHDSMIQKDCVLSSFACVSGGCHIGKTSYIGIHASVRELVCVGNQTIIGMGSVVIKDVTNNVVVGGNPAKVLRENVKLKVFREKQNSIEQKNDTK